MIPSGLQPEGQAGGGPKVAVLTLLFNWLTSQAGGGCVHTVGLCRALQRAGCEIRHIYAQCLDSEIGVGRIEAPYPLDGQAIRLTKQDWQRQHILEQFRRAVEQFRPDVVLLTDSWSFKPHLVAAMREYPVLWRLDSQECLCPLNNCRLLPGPNGSYRQCPSHQLANPPRCQRCLQEFGGFCSPFHQMERALSGVTEPGYAELLFESFRSAAVVLVNNPLVQAAVSPYARRVEMIHPGVEAARFPDEDLGFPPRGADEPKVIFMAGAAPEPTKGFPVLHQACQQLWERRQDFRLVVTGEPPGQIDAFTRFVGWQSQETLPSLYRSADICVVPSLVQDAWPLVAVEAMASSRPVVASRIGGLQFLVRDGATGVLFDPGDPGMLAQCLSELLNDPEERQRLGRAGRQFFKECGSLESIVTKQYLPLLAELAGSDHAAERTGWRR